MVNDVSIGLLMKNNIKGKLDRYQIIRQKKCLSNNKIK